MLTRHLVISVAEQFKKGAIGGKKISFPVKFDQKLQCLHCPL